MHLHFLVKPTSFRSAADFTRPIACKPRAIASAKGASLACRFASRGVIFAAVLADRQWADAGQLHIGQAGFLGPGIELRLYFRKVALRFGLGADIEPRVAQARDH